MSAMQVTFDSNAWEAIFADNDIHYAPLRVAVIKSFIKGYICESTFRIEAIAKADRSTYFSTPHSSFANQGGIKVIDGVEYTCIFSFGPDDERHPGLPEIQKRKLLSALGHGILLLRGMAWMGLPGPQDVENPALFKVETKSDEQRRTQLQHDVYAALSERRVGKAAFDAAGGWSSMASVHQGSKRFQKACAEWADGEIVAAHIAYNNDVLCTADRGRAANISVFNKENRKWLAECYGVKI